MYCAFVIQVKSEFLGGLRAEFIDVSSVMKDGISVPLLY